MYCFSALVLDLFCEILILLMILLVSERNRLTNQTSVVLYEETYAYFLNIYRMHLKAYTWCAVVVFLSKVLNGNLPPDVVSNI